MELAKEIAAYAMVKDRPSHFKLEFTYNETCTVRHALTVTAPVENGKPVLKLSYSPSSGGGPSAWKTVTYSADNVQGASALADAIMRFDRRNMNAKWHLDLRLQGGEVGVWILACNDTTPWPQQITAALKTLLTE